jgi:hypothetical protein
MVINPEYDIYVIVASRVSEFPFKTIVGIIIVSLFKSD